MFSVGDIVKWGDAEVKIVAINAMNTTKGVRITYSFFSPTGNFIDGIQEYELTI